MRAEDWANIAWSDEAYFVMGKNKGRIWVTRRAGEDLLDECCIPQLTQLSVWCMVWALIMEGVKGPMVILEYLSQISLLLSYLCYMIIYDMLS